MQSAGTKLLVFLNLTWRNEALNSTANCLFMYHPDNLEMLFGWMKRSFGQPWMSQEGDTIIVTASVATSQQRWSDSLRTSELTARLLQVVSTHFRPQTRLCHRALTIDHVARLQTCFFCFQAVKLLPYEVFRVQSVESKDPVHYRTLLAGYSNPISRLLAKAIPRLWERTARCLHELPIAHAPVHTCISAPEV